MYQIDKRFPFEEIIVHPRLGSEWTTFLAFHDEIADGYDAYMSGDRNTLFKMKELWIWWAVMFPEQKKILKKIKKTNDLKEYKMLVHSLAE